MIKIIKQENIIQDGIIQATIKGKIIKCYFYNTNPEVNIQIENEDHEIIWQGFLDQEHLNIYPRKIIEILDKTELEHFYLCPNHSDKNNLFIRISGLEEGEKIQMLKIVYDDKETVKVMQ